MKTRLHTHILTAITLAVLMAAGAQAAVLVDFETAGDLATYFDETAPSVDATQETEPGNGYVNSTDFINMLYDTTPGDGNATVDTFSQETVSADFRVPDKAVYGLWLRVNGSRNDGIIVQINFNQAGNNDILRVFTGGAPSIRGQYGTQVTGGPDGDDSRANVADYGQWLTLSATLTNVGSGANEHIQVDAAATGPQGSLTFQAILPDGQYLDAGEVGWSVFPTTADHVNVDNFQVTVVPEPTTALAGLIGMAACVLRRKR